MELLLELLTERKLRSKLEQAFDAGYILVPHGGLVKTYATAGILYDFISKRLNLDNSKIFKRMVGDWLLTRGVVRRYQYHYLWLEGVRALDTTRDEDVANRIRKSNSRFRHKQEQKWRME